MRPIQLLLGSLLVAAVLVAGCSRSSSSDSTGSIAPSESTSGSTLPDEPPAPTPSSTTAQAQDVEVLRVVDAYIHERTMEGAPYYIDSSATEFAGYEEEIVRQDERAICRARFTSAKDVYQLQFVLAKEAGRYVIRRVVLEKLNDLPIRKTLYNRDSLVL